jgi:DNA-binding response OmpR family regulator
MSNAALSPPARLLVVDSEDLVRLLMARMLRDGGFDVREAANGRVALHLLESTPPHFDLILTNSRLPGLDVYSLITQVRSKYPHLRVLHVSGHPDDIEDPRIEELGIPTLEKPFDSKALIAAVERCLRGGLQTGTAGPSSSEPEGFGSPSEDGSF